MPAKRRRTLLSKRQLQHVIERLKTYPRSMHSACCSNKESEAVALALLFIATGTLEFMEVVVKVRWSPAISPGRFY